MKNSEYRISRFALGIDYHSRMKDKIKNLLFGFEDYRIVVDTTPFPERYYARMAGIGFLGKNTMLIHLEQGSYFNLAFVLFKKELPENFQDNQKHSLITDDHEKYCDQCNKCVDACPGSALDGNGYLDANKCFSYWSIESRQSEIQLNSRMGNWVYGCDICQEVCPYNRDVPGKSTIDLYLHPASEIISHGIIPEKDVMKNSSFERVGIKGLERNFAFIHSIE
jgi:epoxyqueuosine reductase